MIWLRPILTTAFLLATIAPIGQAKFAKTPINSKNSNLQEQFPITEIRLWQPQNSSWNMGRMTVPELDTTVKSQVHSPLRNYDRHVARLFEMTYQQCQNDLALQGMNWVYEVANGNVSMGEFRIGCKTSREVVSGYGLKNNAIQQKMTFQGLTQDLSKQHDLEIPQLNIVGKKVDRWMNYVQTILPISSPEQRYLEQMQAFPTDRIQTQTASEVSLRLPRVLPKVMKVADRFILKGSGEGYELCPATVDGKCDRRTVYGFQQFIARKGLTFYSPKQFPTGTIYRPIELARKIPGIYLENCVGQTCVSVVQWKQDGILYEIQAQYLEQPTLVKIANSAIESPSIGVTALVSTGLSKLY